MELTDGSLGNNTLDHFCHHPYAPGGAPLPHQRQTTTSDWDIPIELFTVTNIVQVSSIIVNNFLMYLIILMQKATQS